ncbi:MAG: reverse transcriptase domain-containing protein, partial [Oscillospiraceae bacterium]
AYIDFHRAFDSISHSKLLHKLASYGITGNLLLWIQYFLTGRTQSVRVGSCCSRSHIVTSGVPQGSVIGPLLFIIFINDITDVFEPMVSSKLFADDIKIYSTLSSPASFVNFQNHLNLIQTWSTIWQLPISHSKCHTLFIGKPDQIQSISSFNIAGVLLNPTLSIVDLGIHFDHNLKFSTHINEIVNRAYQRSHLIFRCFLSKNPNSLLRAFKVYVRPLLEYNSSIWSPNQIGLIDSIEKVQRRFTKYV